METYKEKFLMVTELIKGMNDKTKEAFDAGLRPANDRIFLEWDDGLGCWKVVLPWKPKPAAEPLSVFEYSMDYKRYTQEKHPNIIRLYDNSGFSRVVSGPAGEVYFGSKPKGKN